MRVSVRLIFSSAFAGCLRASQLTDSGTKISVSGMNTAVTAGAEVEHRVPGLGLQQLRGDEAADHRADRIADRHDRDAQVAPLVVGELRRHRVDRREHAADAEAGDRCARSPRSTGPRGVRGHEHADESSARGSPGSWGGGRSCPPRRRGTASRWPCRTAPPTARNRARALSMPHSFRMPGPAKAIDSTSKPSRAFRPMVIATATICRRLIGLWASVSRGSVLTDFTG